MICSRFNKISKIISSLDDVSWITDDFENLLKNWSISRFGCKMVSFSGNWAFEVKPYIDEKAIKDAESATFVEPMQLKIIPPKKEKVLITITILMV